MKHKAKSTAYNLAIRHYLSEYKRNWKTSIPGLVLPGIGDILVFYVPPLIIAKLLGRFEGQSQIVAHDLVPYIVLFSGLWLLGEALWRVAFHFIIQFEIAGLRHLYVYSLEELMKKDANFFSDNFAGALTKRVINYGSNYIRFSDTIAFEILPKLIPMVFASVVLWLYSPWLSAALVLFMVLIASIVAPLIRRRQKLVNAREAANTHMVGHVADVISNSQAVTSFAKEQDELAIHMKNVQDYTEKAKKSWMYENLKIQTIMSPMYVVINSIGLVLALYVGGSPIVTETIVVTFAYFSTVTRSIWEFNQIYRNLETSLTEAAQFTELLLEEPKISDAPNAQPLKPTRGAVTFSSVSFTYHENNTNHLFNGLQLDIKPGEKVGLVGRSGGGKTTITKLLLRFMDLNDGSILIDGQDIAKVTQQSLRAAISYVPQEPILFHRTIKENISYANASADDAAIVKAAKLAHAHDFVSKLPDGYETLVGERGVKLSGGQRQRIAIARALIKDAPILLLDEATSALDSESERLIQDALWKLMEGKTTIVIAHRLSTIQKMDRIIVLDEGQIIEQGSHQQLLAKNGTYAQLWSHQSGGFLED
jgi:ATP-binding cassette subfamily B protein